MRSVAAGVGCLQPRSQLQRGHGLRMFAAQKAQHVVLLRGDAVRLDDGGVPVLTRRTSVPSIFIVKI